MGLQSFVRTSSRGSGRRGLRVRLCGGALVAAFLVMSIVSPAPATNTSFPDVPASHQYYTAVTDLASRGVIGGYANGNFGPGDPVTRQQFAKMIVKTLGLTVTGTSITRQQLITMVVRAIDLPEPPAGYAPAFSAAHFSLEEHYANARLAAFAGLLGNLAVDEAYNFSAAATRGDCAQVLHNLLFREAQGPAVDLVHFWWDWGSNWQTFHAESVTDVVGSADDNLIHFWHGQNRGRWQSENVSSKTGRKMALMGWACSWEDYATVQVVGTDADGHLVHFSRKEGGMWKSDDVSQITGKTIKGEASFNWDANGGLGAAVVAAGPNDELLIFHHKGVGQRTVEDVTAATKTATSPGVTLGGWLSWYSWDSIEWDASQFKSPGAVLDQRPFLATGTRRRHRLDCHRRFGSHRADFQSRDRWRLDHALRQPTHRSGGGGPLRRGQSRLRHDPLLARPHPVNQYWREGTGPAGQIAYCDYVCAIAPNGDLVFIWDNSSLRDWTVFNATTPTGFKVRPPELPWWSGHSNLVLPGLE